MASKPPAHLARSILELPTDVIREILALFTTKLSTRKCREFPWFLGHICSTWRCTFLSMTAEFWSSISISFASDGNERVKGIVQFFLERDPAAPFSLDVAVNIPNYPLHPREADLLRHSLELLVDASMRWRDVSFVADLEDLLPLIRTKDRLPLLQRLQLILGHSEEPDPLFDIFQNAPSLTDVVVDYPTGWKFNSMNLKALTVSQMGSDASSFIADLSHMIRLESLVILQYDDTISFPSGIIIILPNLIKLDCNHRWLRFLTAPALQDLSIDYYQMVHEGPFNADIVPSFLCRSSCNMKMSSLRISRTEAVTAVEAIKLTPKIVHLTLVLVFNVAHVFEQLIISANPAQTRLACHMRSLSIYHYTGDCYDDLLFDLVSSRTVSRAAYNYDYQRLQKLVDSRHDFGQPIAAEPRLITLCKERGVQYTQVSEY